MSEIGRIPSSGSLPHVEMVWYRKIIEIRHLTEEGAFAEGQVPDDYGGSELKVEVIQSITMVDNTGSYHDTHFYDVENVMDADRNTGIGVTVEWLPRGVDEPLPPAGNLIEPTGPSAHVATWYEIENPVLDPVVRNRAAQMGAKAATQKAEESGFGF